MDKTFKDTTIQVKEEIEVIAMKGYSTFSQAQGLDPQHQMV